MALVNPKEKTVFCESCLLNLTEAGGPIYMLEIPVVTDGNCKYRRHAAACSIACMHKIRWQES